MFGRAVLAIVTKFVYVATISPVVDADEPPTYTSRFKNATTILLAALRDETLAGPITDLNVFLGFQKYVSLLVSMAPRMVAASSRYRTSKARTLYSFLLVVFVLSLTLRCSRSKQT